jgi:hypothetical protein
LGSALDIGQNQIGKNNSPEGDRSDPIRMNLVWTLLPMKDLSLKLSLKSKGISRFASTGFFWVLRDSTGNKIDHSGRATSPR